MPLGGSLAHTCVLSTRAQTVRIAWSWAALSARHFSASRRQLIEVPEAAGGEDLASLRLHAIKLYKEVRRLNFLRIMI